MMPFLSLCTEPGVLFDRISLDDVNIVRSVSRYSLGNQTSQCLEPITQVIIEPATDLPILFLFLCVLQKQNKYLVHRHAHAGQIARSVIL